MEYTAIQIASLLNGQIEGDANVSINKLSKIEEGIPGSISFLSNPHYNQYIYGTNASIVIVNNSLVLTIGKLYLFCFTTKRFVLCLVQASIISLA